MRIASNSAVDIRQFFVKELHSLYSEPEAEALFYWASEEILGLTLAQMRVRLQEIRVSESELLLFFNVSKRLRRGEPIQYIFATAYFDGLKLNVNPQVLIPRPETEELVMRAAADLQGKSPLRIWDAGTGSGCIALSLQQRFPEAEVWGSDLSEAALQIALGNATRKEANPILASVCWVKQDLLQEEPLKGPWDLLISNPPYVRDSEKSQMHVNVRLYEPSSALYVRDEDPLIYYEKLGEIAQKYLKEGGVFWAEINEYLGEDLKDLFENIGLKGAELIEDFRGRIRFIRWSSLKM